MTKESLKKTLFIDIETVTAEESYDKLDAEWQKLWSDQFFRDGEISDKTPAERYTLKGALRAEFSKIVCLSIGVVMFNGNDEPHLFVKSLTGTEKDILAKFMTICDTAGKYDFLAAHNGKNFDFPFIIRRLIANGMPIPKLLQIQGKKPWEITLIDTQELWRFGDLAFPSLDLLCKILGVPMKSGLDGSKVHETFYVKKDIAAIAAYCANDVAALARVYVKLNTPTLDLPNVTIQP